VATNHGVGGSNPSSPTTGPKGKDLSFTSGGKKIMIGIADAKLLNLGMVFCRNEMALLFLFIYFIGKAFAITYRKPGRNQHIYVLLPVTLSQPGLGRIAEQVQVLVA
jgi:hypothetical protein